MIILLTIFIFFLGLAVGSFLNVVIARIDTPKSIWLARSSCPKCKHKLSAWDLIPLLSFVVLGGKCRYCKKKISWEYPLVELITGAAFLMLFWFFNGFLVANNPGSIEIYLNLFFYFSYTAFLIIIFVYDLKHYLILDRVVLPAAIFALLGSLFTPMGIVSALLGSVVAGVFFLLLFLVSRGKWMGGGDVKLAFVIGLMLGWPNILVGLFLAFVLGAIFGIGLMLSKKKKWKDKLPFGTFLALGTFLAFIIGNYVIDWYMGLLFL